jgi:hypothetical protein
MQSFAENQPITYLVDAVRALTLGNAADQILVHEAGWYVLRSLLWAAGIVAVFAPIAVMRFRRG